MLPKTPHAKETKDLWDVCGDEIQIKPSDSGLTLAMKMTILSETPELCPSCKADFIGRDGYCGACEFGPCDC